MNAHIKYNVLVWEHTICCESLKPDEVIKECENLLEDFKVTPVQASNLEKITRAQAESVLWKRQGVGRITASLVQDIKTLKDSTDSSRCVANVMRYSERDFGNIEHVSYSLRNERKAKELYFDLASKEHYQFVLRDFCLVIDTTFPVFAASPDGVRTCAFHGEGMIEIKCCSAHRNIFVSDIPEIDKNFFLEPHTLKENHRYFTQVQFQMYVCQKQFCDFIVFTETDYFYIVYELGVNLF